AAEFLSTSRRRKVRFEPVGVAQGWSPKSYAAAVSALQRMGYTYIALGGLVPLKTHDILSTLATVADVKEPDTRLHLLGVTRTEHVDDFAQFGVISFDSTSPLRQAFKDDKNNYYATTRSYIAVRVPQAQGNVRLKHRIA